MKYDTLLHFLASLPYFSKETVRQAGLALQIKPKTIDTYIGRYLARKEWIALNKRGMYVTTEFFDKHKGDVAYTFSLANVLRSPSYVSSWTALQYYDLTTEAVREIVSVTQKGTRSYENKAGRFSYHSIKRELFFGFALVPGTFDFFIASPGKALFDLVYFKTNELRSVRREDILSLVEDLRIDFDEMEKKERDIFLHLIQKYGKK